MDREEPFSIVDEPSGDTTVVKVTGEVDMETAPSFQRGLLRALGAGRDGLVVDLSEVQFMDSTALTNLTSAFDSLRRKNERLAIVASDPRMRALFDVARMDRDFAIYDTRDDALQAIGARD